MSTLSTLIDSYGDLANRYAALEDENAALQARVAGLEAERDALKDRVVDLEECVWDINGYAYVTDMENAALQASLEKAKRKLEESVSLTAMNELERMFKSVEAERDALKEEVERCEASIRFWKKGACDLFKELEER